MREIGTLSFLVIFVFWIGLNPKPFLDVMDASVTQLLQQVSDGMKSLPSGGEHGGGHHTALIEMGQQIKHWIAMR
jgi:NADH-quinone oxidoreductase subunit M